MSLPINTLDGIIKRVEALRQLCRDTACEPHSTLHNRAKDRLKYWENELKYEEAKIADKFIDNILDELV